MIKFSCKCCGAILKVPDDKEGKKGKCPKCHEMVTVPRQESKPSEISDVLQQLADFEKASPAQTRHKTSSPYESLDQALLHSSETKETIRQEFIAVGLLFGGAIVATLICVLMVLGPIRRDSNVQAKERSEYFEEKGHKQPYCIVCGDPATHKSTKKYSPGGMANALALPVWLCNTCKAPHSFTPAHTKGIMVVDGAHSKREPDTFYFWPLIILGVVAFMCWLMGISKGVDLLAIVLKRRRHAKILN